MTKIQVDKIRISIGRKVLELTPDELRELRDVLDATFPTETRYVPSQPIIIERPTYPRPWRYWDTTWCGSETGKGQTLCVSSNNASG